MRDYDALIDYLGARMRTPFAWGRARNDCISFGVGAAKAATGRDLLEGSGLRWRSKTGALRVLAHLGGLEQAIADRLEEVSVGLAMRGDFGIHDTPDGPMLVVIEGETAVGPAEDGMRRVPRIAVRRAFNIEAPKP